MAVSVLWLVFVRIVALDLVGWVALCFLLDCGVWYLMVAGFGGC